MPVLSRREAARRAVLALAPKLAQDKKRLEAAVDALLALDACYERRTTRRRTPLAPKEGENAAR